MDLLDQCVRSFILQYHTEEVKNSNLEKSFETQFQIVRLFPPHDARGGYRFLLCQCSSVINFGSLFIVEVHNFPPRC